MASMSSDLDEIALRELFDLSRTGPATVASSWQARRRAASFGADVKSERVELS